MTNLIGPDLSFWQDNNGTPQGVDFAKMRTMTHYVIIRAGQNHWIDSDFMTNWKAAKEAGLWRGSYWLYDSRTDPNQQADLWSAAIGNDFPECGVWMDFEEIYGGAWSDERHMRTFAERVLNNMPSQVEVGVYTAYYYWLERVPVHRRGWWIQFPLWIANYDVDQPSVPAPWTDWLLWQYTDRGDGSAYGVESSRIDLNYFNGDIIKFKDYFKISDTFPQPPGGTMRYEMRTIDPRTNVRPDHNTNNSALTSIPNANTLVEGDELFTAEVPLSNSAGVYQIPGDQWLKTTFNGTTGWVARIHKGISICDEFVDHGAPTGEITLTHTIDIYSDGSIRIDDLPYP